MTKPLPKINTSSLDDLFTTEEQRQEEKLEKVIKIPIDDIADFKKHPFNVRLDEEMESLIKSVEENGILVPVLVRPNKKGNGYEMVSGHRRKFAMEKSGATEIDAIVRDLDDDQATIIMVDSNIQRENILPSERGFAYKMKLDAMKHQGKRVDLTSSQVGTKLRTDQVMAEELGESRNQIQRYIRLTNLIPELLELVDQKQISFNPAVELSYLAPEEQEIFLAAMEEVQAAPSLSQAQRLKKLAQEGNFTMEAAREIMSEVKKGDLERVTFRNEQLRKYFPRSYTTQQMQDTILKLLDQWQKKKARDQER